MECMEELKGMKSSNFI
jgi:hypothetical protein